MESEVLAMRGRQYPATRLHLAPRQARRLVARSLPEEAGEKLRQALRRG